MFTLKIIAIPYNSKVMRVMSVASTIVANWRFLCPSPDISSDEENIGDPNTLLHEKSSLTLTS